MTPMIEYEQLRIKLSTMPDEIIEQHSLHAIAHNDWAHAEIRK